MELLTPDQPFALLKREGCEDLEILRGTLSTVDTLSEIPDGKTLALIPYRQIAERGFDCVDDGTPLRCLGVTAYQKMGLAQVISMLPKDVPQVADLGFDISDDEYAEIVQRVLTEEIGRGEGANFVIHRTALASTQQAETPKDVLTVAAAAFRQLLEHEEGAYWTFLVHLPGERTLVGASPERHVSVDNGLVMMNPISGTCRPSQDLIEFLNDPKEINELSMVLDEELKMMANVAEHGGQVLGPYLKRMSQLIHTEYLLAGRTTMDVRDVLRATMFAPTVTGSPIENAARVIARHEKRGRGYYASVMALVDGDSVDAPILIRCADFSPNGLIQVRVGATLVRDSTPAGEVAETHTKAAGVLSSLGLRPAAPAREITPVMATFANELLRGRNERLSRFWFDERSAPQVSLNRTALIVDAEDTFTSMLAHLMRTLGLDVTIRPALDLPAMDDFDIVVAGPGPGDPRNVDDRRIASLHRVVVERLLRKKPLLAVCLGHQVLSLGLGLKMHQRDAPYQGVPRDIDLFGRPHRVGFYSTYTALSDVDSMDTFFGRVELARDAHTGEVHALRGPRFAGVQFHPESVLTEHGPELLAGLLGKDAHASRAN